LALQHLTESYDAMVGALLEPLDVWLPTDFAFHAAIAAASGTHRLPHMLAGVWLQHQAFLQRMDRGGVDPSTREQRLETLPRHERILTAIRARDEAGSDQAVRLLLGDRREIVLVKFREMGLGPV
jgi:DNA-binding FadR family transcriptional regulator